MSDSLTRLEKKGSGSGSRLTNHRFARAIAALIGAIAGLVLALGLASAHNFNGTPQYKWNTGVDIVVESRIGWDDEFEFVTGVFDSLTPLDLDYCGVDGNCGNVIHVSGYYGENGYISFVDSYSSSQPCWTVSHALTGNCDETYNQVDFSYLVFNEYYDDYWDDWWEVDYLASHEMAHAFGFGHVPCEAYVSVVHEWAYEECDPDFSYYLRDHDVDDFDAKY